MVKRVDAYSMTPYVLDMLRHRSPIRAFFLAAIVATIWSPAPAAASGQPEAGVRTLVNLDSSGTPAPDDLNAPLPFRREIRHGRLDNGLEYFAVHHPHPADTVVLRLVVDAGSVLETPDQTGLAHFVEHMAFNGTEEFGENELVAYLESLGIRFGPDVNAATSFDQTVYKLELPADDPEALATGFDVMHQWASALTFTPEAIERERGVIMEEWRGGRGASQRMMEQHFPVLFAGSRYADRLPIGDPDTIRSAPRSEFVDFYSRWYRPDNMALIAVGDLSTEELESRIRDAMAGIPRPSAPLERPYYFVPDRGDLRVSVATDSEASRSTVSLYVLSPPPPTETIGDYRHMLVRALFSSVMNERLRDDARDPSAPLTAGGIGFNRFLRGTEIAVSSAVVRDDRALDAFRLLATEVERARRHGVLEEELNRARRRMLQGIDDARVNFESRPASSVAEELVRHWTEGESVPGIEFEAQMYHALLPDITADEVSAVAEQFSAGDGGVILASLRSSEDGTLPDGEPVPTDEQFAAVLEEVRSSEIAPPEQTAVDARLLPQAPVPGAIVDRVDHPAVETTELRLSNGMRVFVRQTDFREDEELFSAYSPGGLALIDDTLTTAARLAPQVALESGLGGLDAAALERLMSGRSADLSASLGRVSESLSGSSREQDMELLFQMIHAAFTQPRFEQQALDNVRQRVLQQISGSRASPQGQFSRELQHLFANGDPRLDALDPDAVSDVTLDQIREVYTDRFRDPGDFALFFVGSVDVGTVQDLARRYLASIPQSSPSAESAVAGFHETIPADRYPRPDGIVDRTVRAGREPVAQLVMVMHGPYQWSQEENYLLNSVASLLDIRLREDIREDAGGAYSVGAGGWRWRTPQPWAFIQLGFGLAPDRVDELRARALDVVDEVATTVPSNDYVERIQAQQRDAYQRNVQENGYWLSVLQFAVQHGRDLARIQDYPDLIDRLTGEAIRDTAARYLNPDRRIELLLMPETPADDGADR